MRRVLVIGGYGGFGARVSHNLAQANFHVIVAGRSLEKATAFCAKLRLFNTEPAVLDRTSLDAAMISALAPWAVVDAAGPWQGQALDLPRACIEAGCHYFDISDARDFVGAIETLEAAALDAGVTAIAGASTAPALTSAVCDDLTEDLDHVTKIEVALSASNRATGSGSITAAVLSYAGKGVPLWRGGQWRNSYGWLEMQREGFDHAGRPYTRLTGICDVPDHDILPDRYAGAPAVTFRAGTESWLQNRAIWITAWLVRLRLLRDGRWMNRPARFVQWMMRKLGGQRSAMSVEITGWRDGEAIRKRWELLAEDGDGPSVPTLAVDILLPRLREGYVKPGARSASGTVTLAEYDRASVGLSISHSTKEISYTPLYRRIMGEKYGDIPAQIKDMHDVAGELTAQGEATIELGRNPLARLIGWLFRFPKAGVRIPLHVWMDEENGVETWRRDFAGREMRSELSQRGDLLVEKFGALRFGFALKQTRNGLSMVMHRWWVGPFRLPIAFAPKSPAREYVENGRFNLDVPISLPLVGLIVHYRGWLKPQCQLSGDLPRTRNASPRAQQHDPDRRRSNA